MPATAADAKGLLLAAIDDPNPVIVLEHKLLYRTSGPVPEEAVRVPLGAAVHRTGNDLSIVATGVMVSRSLEAADILADEGIDVSVIDPRTPPRSTTRRSRRRRPHRRALLVQEAPATSATPPRSRPGSPSRPRCTACWPRSGGSAASTPRSPTPPARESLVPQVADIVDAALQMMKES